MDQIKTCIVCDEPEGKVRFTGTRRTCNTCRARRSWQMHKAKAIRNRIALTKAQQSPSIGPSTLKIAVSAYSVPGIRRIGCAKDFVNLLTHINGDLRCEGIFTAVSRVTCVSMHTIRRKTRIPEVVIARRLCYWFLKKLTRLSLVQINQKVKGIYIKQQNREHTTAMSSIEAIDEIVTATRKDSNMEDVMDMISHVEDLLIEFSNAQDPAAWIEQVKFKGEEKDRITKRKKPAPVITIKHIAHEQPKINRAKW